MGDISFTFIKFSFVNNGSFTYYVHYNDSKINQCDLFLKLVNFVRVDTQVSKQ